MESKTRIIPNIIFLIAVMIAFTPVVFDNQIFLGVSVFKTLYFQVLVLISFALWGVLCVQNNAYLPKKSLLSYSVIGFLVILFIVDFFSVNAELSLLSNLERLDGFLLYLHLGILFFVWGAIFDSSKWRKLLIISLLIGFSVACFGLYNQIPNKRIVSTIGNSAYLSFYVLCVIYLIFFALVFSKSTKLRAIISLCFSAFLFFILLKTGTRSAIVSFSVSVVVFVGLFIWKSENKNQKKWVLVSGITTLIIAYVLTKKITQNSFLSRIINFSPDNDYTSQVRLDLWNAAWEGFRDHPLMGWGQGNFNAIFNHHGSLQLISTEEFFDKSHNVFLELLSGTGVLGTLAYVAIFVIAVFQVWEKTQLLTIQKIALTCFFINYWVFHFFNFDTVTGVSIVFAVLAFVNSVSMPTENHIHLPTSLKISLASVFIILAVFVGYQYNFRTYKTAKGVADMLKSDDINKTISLGKATYDNALIGKTDVALAMLALREQVGTTNLTNEQKQLFFETAIPMAEAEYEKNPHFAGLPTYIADSYKFKGDTTKAILVMEDFCAKHPNSPTSWIDFGLLLLDLGKNKDAIAAFEKTAKDNPKSMIPQVYKLYAYGKMKDTLMFLNTISNITWKDRVLYQDQIAKAFIQSNQIPLYFQYIKSCPNKAEVLNTNSYLQWAYLALSVGNAIEYRYAWHQYVENIKLKRKLSNIEKMQLDETISQTIQNQLEVPKTLEIIDKFGE